MLARRGAIRPALIVFALCRGSALAAQAIPVVDAGQFSIFEDGRRVATESFTITRLGTGPTAQFRAVATRREGSREVTVTTITDGNASPLRYSAQVAEGGTVVDRLEGNRVGTRLTLRLLNHDGDASTHDVLLADGMVLLDGTMYHQLYFLFVVVDGGRAATAIAPLTGARTAATPHARGPDPVEIAGTRVPATRFSFGDADIWLGAGREVLRVEIPTRRIIVMREQPPR